MLRKWLTRIVVLIIIAGIGFAAWQAMREQPVPVDLATVESGPMQVTVDEEGVTRVRDVYVVSAPIAGRLDRSALEEGDLVEKDETLIAAIRPLDPPLLDERTRAELRAAVEAARSAFAVAQLEAQRARTALSLAVSENRRVQELAEKDFVSASQFEQSQSELQLRQAEVAAADANIQLRRAEVSSAEARLRQPDEFVDPKNGGCCVRVTAPTDGVVLKVIAKSEQAVAAGTVLAEIGDLSGLEVAVDLLSEDAVRIGPDTPATITDWGGGEVIEAKVRRVDPAAFSKVSALGIEEQRVEAVLDLASVPDNLGHGFRVVARIVLWSEEDVLQVPVAAIFRDQGEWVVFVVSDGMARLQPIKVGHMNDTQVEVLEGLSESDRVVLYPNDQLEDGRTVRERSEDIAG